MLCLGGLRFDLHWRLPFGGGALVMLAGFSVGWRARAEDDFREPVQER